MNLIKRILQIEDQIQHTTDVDKKQSLILKRKKLFDKAIKIKLKQYDK